MKPPTTRFALAIVAVLCVLMIAGCGNAEKPTTQASMRTAAFGTPPPPDIQAKLNAQGDALAAKEAQAKAAALAHPNPAPPTKTAH